MGADVHLFVEVLVDNEWILLDQPEPIRNYDLFEKMAGVRGDIYKALTLPKGLPSNISKGTALHYQVWKLDAHTESWFNSLEIETLEKWYQGQNRTRTFEQDFGYLFGNGYNRETDCPVDDWRFIFWFDN